jgi:NAD(P)H-flavin reductase
MATRPFRVVGKHRENADTVTLALEPADGVALPFGPGQFTMVYAFGVGEVPISISGDPARPGRLEHTIRDVGGVTHALFGRTRGDLVGIRGPYGTTWQLPVAAPGPAPVRSVDAAPGGPLAGHPMDIVFVAGGIGLAPLRPALLDVLAHRDRYRRVVLLYGARTPEDVLFARELESWQAKVDVNITVDYAAPTWRGRVGLVTALIPKAGFDPQAGVALLCGPEVMMRHAASALAHRGLPPERIQLSMERNMKCGVGLCGHCQLRELFVCTDGPVFSYQRVEPLLALREV